MDAKSKAEFINAVASGAEIPCPQCGARNTSSSKYCMTCGAELSVSEKQTTAAPAFAPVSDENASPEAPANNAPAFAPVSDENASPEAPANDAPAFEPAKAAPPPVVEKYVEPHNVFADGLPEWSIEPPQVMVRRH